VTELDGDFVFSF